MKGQLGFADHIVSASGSRRKDHLGEIAALMDWSGIEELLRPLRCSRLGRPPYPPLSLFKVLLLQRWYGLSDEAMEDALSDRVSFRRFAGLSLEEMVPDASTLCRFRGEMAAADLGERLFEAAGKVLSAKGFLVRSGTLIDASLISAAVAEPRKQPGGGASKADPEAVWTKKGSKATFGYKLHVALDQGSGLVRQARLTKASTADCALGPDLVQGDEQMVYADMAYDNARMRRRLADLGIANGVMQRPNKHHPLTETEKRRNAVLGRVRGRVESLFGTLKRSYQRHRMRYRGLARNSLDILLTLLAINLRRARKLALA